MSSRKIKKEIPIWQPISMLPVIAELIEGALEHDKTMLPLLLEAQSRPGVLDVHTIKRMRKNYSERIDFVDIYYKQLERWHSDPKNSSLYNELDRLREQVVILDANTKEFLKIANGNSS